MRYGQLAAGGLLFVVAMLLGATCYALGHSVADFRWSTFRSGGIVFLLILGGTAAAGLVLAVLLRLLFAVSPVSWARLREHRQLRRAKRRALSRIEQRRTVQEEQARLTAMLQAAYLLEKESTRMANSQAVREFQKALQSGVVRSCEVVFDHLQRTVDQYEQVVAEIENSPLPAADKTSLLDELSQQLNTAGLDQRHRLARRMMEDAIWRVRLRKARLLSRRNPESARKYLQSVRQPDTSHRILIQINALLKEL